MVNYETALKNILENAHLLSEEKVKIEDSVGRILREDIYSKIEMPPFDKSAVDGYAARSRDSNKAPAKLKCVGLIQAGENAGVIKKGSKAQFVTWKEL